MKASFLACIAMLGFVFEKGLAQSDRVAQEDQSKPDVFLFDSAVSDSVRGMNERLREFLLNERGAPRERVESTGLVIGGSKFFIRIWPEPVQPIPQSNLNRMDEQLRGWRQRKKNP